MSIRNNHLVVQMLSVAAVFVVGCEPDIDGAATGRPTQGNTADFEQAEAVVTIAPRGALSDVMVVSYNDRTQDPNDPKIIYPSGPSGDERTIFRGASLMGWSTSVDGGQTFTYRGKVQPPAGWSMIYGDPALATSGEQIVYLANIASSDAAFPSSGEIVDMSPRDFFDGFCIARSGDGGLTFPAVKCFKKGVCAGTNIGCSNDADCSLGGTCNGVFYDGTSLAANDTDVFFASTDTANDTMDVWHASSTDLNFTRIAKRPFDGIDMTLHPRLRIFGNRLFILGHKDDGDVVASFLEIGTSVFSAPLLVSLKADLSVEEFSDRAMRNANQFSFDIGSASDGTQIRIATTRIIGSHRFIDISRCAPSLMPNPNQPEFAQ
jgi:hypothetical protein